MQFVRMDYHNMNDREYCTFCDAWFDPRNLANVFYHIEGGCIGLTKRREELDGIHGMKVNGDA